MSTKPRVAAPQDAGTPAGDRPTQTRWSVVWRRGYTLPGLWVALVFVCLSLSPSLLPRTGITQGLVCGITGAIGYGLGVLAAWAWRAFADRDARPARRRSWQIFAVVAVARARRRDAARSLLAGPDPHVDGRPAGRSGVAAARAAGRRRRVRRVDRAVARAAAGLPMARRPAGAGSGHGRLGRSAGRLSWRERRCWSAGCARRAGHRWRTRPFSVTNATTEAGVVQPTVAQRSGSPASLVPWESLGQQGRTFAGTGPSRSRSRRSPERRRTRRPRLRRA